MNDRHFFGGLAGALLLMTGLLAAFNVAGRTATTEPEPAPVQRLNAIDSYTVLDRQIFARMCAAAVAAGDAGEIPDEFALNAWMIEKQASRHQQAAAKTLAPDMEAACPTNPAPWSELRPLLQRWAKEADPTAEVPQ